MMRQYELVEIVQSYDPDADEALLNRAYVYAMKAHVNQTRASGDPYFSHPLEVAGILTKLKLDDATIATALLHDVIEDTDTTRSEIDELFGPRIGALVDGLTKIKRLDLVSREAQQAENFRKLLVAISSDIRVLLVKLADRLHNMRTLEHKKPESRLRNSEETLEIYAPLAGRMGMQAMRDELEAHAFRWVNPDGYKAVTDKLAELTERSQGLVDEIASSLTEQLNAEGIQAEVIGRQKRPYSIWRKMTNRQISLEQLSDIFGFRIIVGSIEECYRVLGVVHTTWRTVPGRFKDYISTPKQNNYQSIHTTVVGTKHQRVELQIRTRKMHDVAEYGVAAHALYKDAPGPEQAAAGGKNSPRDVNPYVGLRRMVEALLEGSNPEEFLEHTKLELFQDQVFCFTPNGRLIALPRGGTPLDFAFAVHSDLGRRATGAIVNGRKVPIDTKLRNGDEIEILSSKTHTPPAAWENFAVTGRARSAIRRSAREKQRHEYIELGRRLVLAEMAKLGRTYEEGLLAKAIGALPQKTPEDILAAIGRKELRVSKLMPLLITGYSQQPRKEETPKYKPRQNYGRAKGQKGWYKLASAIGLKFRTEDTEPASRSSSIAIRGLKDNVPVKFAEGGAVPGDRIVGVMIDGEGIRIFHIHSPRLSEFEHQEWIDVTWDLDPEKPERFPAVINITAPNKPGTLAEVADVIGGAGGNIDSINLTNRGIEFAEMRIGLEVWDLPHLTHIISGLKEKTVVSDVERVFE